MEAIHSQARTGVIVLPYACELLNEVPADEEIKVIHQEPTAEWLGGRGDYKCSVCGEEAPNDGYNPAPYCYNCGRKMKRMDAHGTE